MSTTKRKAEPSIFTAIEFTRGPSLKNRLVLSPLTNEQSNQDGSATDDDLKFLTMRAKGGFAMITTCASNVQKNGLGFNGQLGCYSDAHIEGLKRIAEAIKSKGAISSLQLHHAGPRSHPIITDRVGPSEDLETNTRSMSDDEIETLINDFTLAALRAEKAGFDGVQIHAAHGYIIAQFVSPTLNNRNDRWGGSLTNRLRLLTTIIEKIRSACHSNFQIGVRISPEGFGLKLEEMIQLCNILKRSTFVDYVDLSLWDVEKEPEEDKFKGKKLISYFTEQKGTEMRIGVAGKIIDAKTALNCLTLGADFVGLGRAGILQHDFPLRIQKDLQYTLPNTPVTESYLESEGLSKTFINYLKNFPNFIR